MEISVLASIGEMRTSVAAGRLGVGVAAEGNPEHRQQQPRPESAHGRKAPLKPESQIYA